MLWQLDMLLSAESAGPLLLVYHQRVNKGLY